MENLVETKLALTKALEPSDYNSIKPIVSALEQSIAELVAANVRIDIGHPHRFWEYGMAINAMLEWAGEKKYFSIVDMGPGVGLLGPALSLYYGKGLTEIEPNEECEVPRQVCIDYLRKKKRPEMKWIHGFMQALPITMQWDVVFCISVVEHVPHDAETGFWNNLALRVRKGGLLFMTTDVMPRKGGSYFWDNLRNTNYTMEMLTERATILSSHGFEFFGGADFEYHGEQVHDYTFASLCMVKK